MRHSLRVSCRLLVVLTALGLASGPAGAARSLSDQDWVPLAQGNRWSYQLQKESLFVLPGGASQKSQSDGSDVEEVTQALGRVGSASNAYEIVHRRDEAASAAGPAQSHSESLVVSADQGQLVVHSGEADGKPIHIHRPVVLLPASPRPGMKWDAGAMETQGLRFDMTGEVLGFEDVRTPAGDFQGCLKVRFTGTVTGSLDMQGAKLGIEDAQVETTEWYAPGIGMVKDATQLRMSVRMPDGNAVQAQERSQRLLDGYSLGRGAASRAR